MQGVFLANLVGRRCRVPEQSVLGCWLSGGIAAGNVKQAGGSNRQMVLIYRQKPSICCNMTEFEV